MNHVKATIEWGEGRITFEGPEAFVSEQVAKYSQASSKPSVGDQAENEYLGVSPADLVARKDPKGHHEIVAVLAFALSENGKNEFSEDDIKRMYLQARIRPPKVVGQALRDAKNKFDLIENGEKRGLYRLSHHGDRTVRYDLPRK